MEKTVASAPSTDQLYRAKPPVSAIPVFKCFLFIGLSLALSGCTSLGKGFGEALLNQQKEDTRICHVVGKSFPGIAPTLEKEQGTTKVLMVHGVGSHIPGYSTEFLQKLSKELNLTVQNSRFKEFALVHPDNAEKDLGVLRVRRLMDETMKKTMLFYELTWSPITDNEKSILAYDNSGEFSYRRAEINNLLKKFSNDTGPDPMIYLGESHNDILMAFRQSMCWMIGYDWETLPESAAHACLSLGHGHTISAKAVTNMTIDDYAIVSHSLGSRITMDSMQEIAQNVADEDARRDKTWKESAFIREFQNKEIPLYMLSNQLPLLQMGRKVPQVRGQKEAYCTKEGSHYNDRIVNKTSIIAFSDPNDILSYAIPHGFSDQYLDSRLCIDTTNIDINVAEIIDLFGAGKFANPLTAHTGYDSDDRVVALIAKGIGTPASAQLIDKKKCEWTRLVD